MKASLRVKLLVALVMLSVSAFATAQDTQDTQDPSGDPPTRVARLQYMQGQVSLQPGGVDDWVEASLNRPLTTADRIWTDRDARAELTMASSALRMGSETSVTITNLDDNTAQIELDQGSLNLSVRYLNQGEIVEVDTPNFAYTVSQPGEYRFNVMPDDDQSEVAVWRGSGDATGQGNAVRVRSGQRFLFSGGQSLSYTATGLGRPDGFDDWCEVRERREVSSPSAGYVAAGTIGYEDLDDNGSWQASPVYGTVWYPRVHPGWAPYREGHWAWVNPWGWTWVDDAPWGFAPFHYGRWVTVGDRWAWVPGPVGVRPVYAPALVAWVGGPSFGVSVGIGGGVGWFPLGWRDPYLPAYRVSPRYAREVNISNSRVVNVTVVNNYYTTNNVNIRNTTVNNIHYENVRVNGAVTGMSQSTFASGRSVGRNSVVIPANAMGHASVMAGAAVVPTRDAVLGGHAPMRVPQHIVAPRPVVSRVAPPPRPVSFEHERPLLEKSNGVPLSREVRNNLRRSEPAPAVNQQAGRPAMQNQPGRAPDGRGPGANQQYGRPPVANAPAQQQGRPPVANAPAQPQQQGRPPVANAPAQPQQQGGRPGWTNPGSENTRTPASNAPNTLERPANANQPPANANQGGAPSRNVPRPPQAGGNGYGEPSAARPNNNLRRPSSLEGEGRAPANNAERPAQGGNEQNQRTVTPAPARPASPAAPTREAAPTQAPTRGTAPQDNLRRNQGGYSEGGRAPATETQHTAAPPARPAGQPAPTREAAPAQAPRNAAPPARTAEPAPQHHNAPPPKENKEKEKEKDPKGH